MGTQPSCINNNELAPKRRSALLIHRKINLHQVNTVNDPLKLRQQRIEYKKEAGGSRK